MENMVCKIWPLMIVGKICHVSFPYIIKLALEASNVPSVSAGMFVGAYVSRFTGQIATERKNVHVKQQASLIATDYYNTQRTKHTQMDASFLRSLERARAGVKTLHQIKYTHIWPLLFDFVGSGALLLYHMDSKYLLMAGCILSVYILDTSNIAQKRLFEKKDLNQVENSLYNSTDKVTDLTLHESRLATSLCKLNIRQYAIMTLGYCGMCAMWYCDNNTGFSDYLFLHMSMQQIFQPLQQYGMVYREYHQAKIDIN